MGRKSAKKNAFVPVHLPPVNNDKGIQVSVAAEVAMDLFNPHARACNSCRYGYASLVEPFFCHRVNAMIEPPRPRVDCEYWRRVWK